MFQLEQHAAPLEKTQKRDFLSFLGRLEAALHCDEHLRRSFFPLWKGDVADKVPTADDWQAFTMAFDAFLAKLPVIRLVAGLDDYASTQRHPGPRLHNPFARPDFRSVHLLGISPSRAWSLFRTPRATGSRRFFANSLVCSKLRRLGLKE
jgi:hypothetical protein